MSNHGSRYVTIVVSMTPPQAQPKFQLVNTPDYRESYANSVQIRVNLWDFFLMFGTVNQTSPENVTHPQLSGHLSEPAAGQGAVEHPDAEYLAVRGDIRRD